MPLVNTKDMLTNGIVLLPRRDNAAHKSFIDGNDTCTTICVLTKEAGERQIAQWSLRYYPLIAPDDNPEMKYLCSAT
jgi:hypothetical protein